MMKRAIGIDEITEYFTSKDVSITSNGNGYYWSTEDDVSFRFDNYKQLKAFYLGFKHSNG